MHAQASSGARSSEAPTTLVLSRARAEGVTRSHPRARPPHSQIKAECRDLLVQGAPLALASRAHLERSPVHSPQGHS